MAHETDGLRIAVSVEQLWQPVPGGSGTYVRELVRRLVHEDGLSVYGVKAKGPSGDRHGLPAGLPLRSSLLPRPALYAAWSRLRAPRVPGRADVVHATTWAVPPRSAPLVVTVHDLAFRRNPAHFTPHGVRFFDRALRTVRKDADLVVVPSTATLEDCLDAGLEPDRLRVVPHGTQAPDLGPGEAAAFRSRHGLDRPFVLWCGAVEPRKNVSGLLAAYELLVHEGSPLDLVLVGPSGWGDAPHELRESVARMPGGRVHVLGALPRHELEAAFAAARVFCFPSWWEGFGMPVLEAQAHGTPVVTSAGTSMEEIGGGGIVAVDPADPADIARGIAEAAGPEHARLAERARENAALYTWDEAARRHAAVYREAADGAAR